MTDYINEIGKKACGPHVVLIEFTVNYKTFLYPLLLLVFFSDVVGER